MSKLTQLKFIVVALSFTTLLRDGFAFTVLDMKTKEISFRSTSRSTIHLFKPSSAENGMDVGRRQLIKKAPFFVSLASIALTPNIANADITNKIASSSALRAIKKSVKELKNMEFYAIDNDYANVKQALRVPPFTEVRKNCKTIIVGAEDPAQSTLQASYDSFIKGIELLDSNTSLGLRGRKNVDLQPSYDSSLKALIEFYELAKGVVEPPTGSSE